jgi:NAD(P)-dependent dehydrogenase (short-subunit alcohol dehydrogenase family)
MAHGTLAGKIALITGASRGIGRAIALRFAHEGAMVAVHYGRNRQAAEETLRDIERQGGAGFLLGVDLTTRASVDTLLSQLDAELLARTGSNRFDILVNNAAIAPFGTLESTSEALFDELFMLNVKVPFFLTQKAPPRLRDGGRGIHVSSAISQRGASHRTVYSMTKGAIDVFTRAAARELAPRSITVNALAPGYVETDINAEYFTDPNVRAHAEKSSVFKRLGQPEDIAGVALFLASADSHWVTGHYMDATGGSLL